MLVYAILRTCLLTNFSPVSGSLLDLVSFHKWLSIKVEQDTIYKRFGQLFT